MGAGLTCWIARRLPSRIRIGALVIRLRVQRRATRSLERGAKRRRVAAGGEMHPASQAESQNC